MLSIAVPRSYAQNKTSLAEESPKPTTQPSFQPSWIFTIDFINIIDNYPAFLISSEKFINNDISILLKAGPVLEPESFDNKAEFNDYQGFKSRMAIKKYTNFSLENEVNTFLMFDIGFHQDWYTIEYDIDKGGYFKIEESDYQRKTMDLHFGWGFQRFLSSENNVLLELSLGVGFQRIDFIAPNINFPVVLQQAEITTDPGVHPLSFRLSCKLGYLFRKKSKP